MSGIVGYDLEIALPFPEDGEWRGKDLGVSCAAAYALPSAAKVWPGARELDGNVKYHERLSREACREMVQELWDLMYVGGWEIVTWNGCGFDWPFLAEACGETFSPGGYGDDREWTEKCAQLALGTVDPAFLCLCQQGYMLSLGTVGEALGLGGKTEGMKGDLAPWLWDVGSWLDRQPDDDAHARMAALGVSAGTLEAQRLVLRYCVQDAKLTALAAAQLANWGTLTGWINSKGNKSRAKWPVSKHAPPLDAVHPASGRRLPTVRECLEIPEPDTSWMDKGGDEKRDRPTREKAIGWALEVLGETVDGIPR